MTEFLLVLVPSHRSGFCLVEQFWPITHLHTIVTKRPNEGSG